MADSQNPEDVVASLLQEVTRRLISEAPTGGGGHCGFCDGCPDRECNSGCETRDCPTVIAHALIDGPEAVERLANSECLCPAHIEPPRMCIHATAIAVLKATEEDL
jgi:hypothetical protein